MGTKTNRLTTLLGDYMSDSDNEDGSTSATCSADKANKDLNGTHSNTSENVKNHQITTFWTECIDQNTGHPYYWNTESKEVTWERPEEYVNYLNYMKSICSPLPKDCWVIGFSDDSQVPYYVNEITRVVSWEKPENFKEKSPQRQEPSSQASKAQSIKQNKAPSATADKKSKLNRKKSKKQSSKPIPKHLQSTSSDDEKIEVISEYVEGKQTSSDEEDGSPNKVKSKNTIPQKSLHLVAAYATDSESEAGNDLPAKKQGTDKGMEQSTKVTVPKQPELVPALNINANSFASIITGGKSGDADMDEELNKFKEELEMDLQNVAAASENTQDQTVEPKENFDEKTFQRKRRIEFSVNTTKSKDEEPQNKVEQEQTADDSNKDRPSVKSKPQYIGFQKSHVEFETKLSSEAVVYGPKPLSPTSDNEGEALLENKSNNSAEIDDLCDIISGKVKFLSVGKAEVSAVQIMSIQLEALNAAFQASCLDSNYFFKWLKATSDELQMLEQNAAPEGWECKWDRDNSQYCYLNRKTNETRWEFPHESVPVTQQEPAREVDDDENADTVVDGQNQDDDAMDICTTPPPPPSPPVAAGGCYQWDPGNPSVQIADVPRSADISGELASFYSDIATIDSTASNLLDNEPSGQNINNVNSLTNDDSSPSSKKAKKRKKVKVPGLGSKMQEVSSMVANWQKAQKELGN